MKIFSQNANRKKKEIYSTRPRFRFIRGSIALSDNKNRKPFKGNQPTNYINAAAKSEIGKEAG